MKFLKNFNLIVEKQSRNDIKMLKTNGGDEYNSMKYDILCKDEVIIHIVVAPYTPQHNWIRERRNKTLINMVISMLKEKKMPHQFWVEALATTTYILI